MKSKITLQPLFRKFTAILLSNAILCSSYIQTLACGGWEESYEYYNLIADNSASMDPFGPYYLDGHSLFGRSDSPDNTVLYNVDAWQAYFGIKNSEAVQELIFNSEPEELIGLVQSIKTNGTIPSRWQNNELAKKLAQKPKAPVLDYLVFSKKCEPHFTQGAYWWEDVPPADTMAMQQLLQEGKALLKKTKDKELKMRYQYQLLRLQFYMHHYEEVAATYKKEFENKKWNNKLTYQAMNYDFGAHWRMANGQDSIPPAQKATLILKLYRVFQSCEDCAILHYTDLHYFDAADYMEAAAVIENPQDKIDLWMLASFRSVPTHVALDKVLAADPNAPEVQVLLSRMLQSAQGKRFQKSESTTADYFAVEEWNQSQFVLKKASINTKITDRAPFAFMLAYFDYMNGKYFKARTELENAAILNGDNTGSMARNIRVLRSLLDLEKWTAANLEKSHQLPAQLNEVMSINNPELTEYTFRRLEELAARNEKLEKETLLFASMYRSIQSNLNLSRIIILENSRDNIRQSGIERWIWQRNQLVPSTLHRWKGDAYLNMLKFEEAAVEYRKAGSSESLMTDPFVIRVVDCHDCDHKKYKGTYTRLSFSEKMIDLKKATAKGNANAAMEYANALYNLTDYGNSRDILNHNLATDNPEGPDTYYDMKPALAAYGRALQLYTDKENKARVLWMLAKCEQNDYYNQPDVGHSEYSYYNEPEVCVPKKNQEYRKNFAALRKNYAQTAFYKEAIKECSYFQHYVKAH